MFRPQQSAISHMTLCVKADSCHSKSTSVPVGGDTAAAPVIDFCPRGGGHSSRTCDLCGQRHMTITDVMRPCCE
jgi:hypothetical protein